jgi:predicted glycosyltransferase
MGVPSVVIMDYEHVKGFINPTWVMMPEVISNGAVKFDSDRILKYHGIKEDVYVPFFRPDPAIKTDLGLRDEEILVTIRPPATEAHYHNPESEGLFSAAVNRLGKMEETRMVIVPRDNAQGEWIRSLWREWCGSGRIIIPKHVVDGLNLLWHSDLVISGGGTMNREAAALGIPVYSIFRGKVGAVDRYLSESGRLTLLESVDDVGKKLLVQKRVRKEDGISSNDTALRDIVAGIMKALENGH